MLLKDYGLIIIRGLCNSPKFLVSHFRREIKKLNDSGYENDEIENDFKEVIALFRNRIDNIYERNLDTFKKYSKEDKDLPKEKKYNYPKPDIEQISISEIQYPSGHKDILTGLTRTFKLSDLREVETALNEVLQPTKQALPPQKTEKEMPKIPAKFYALYHWLKIEIGTETQFAKNDNDKFIRKQIEAYAELKYSGCSPQGFYRSFIDLDITKRTAIANSFGKGYKQTLIYISNNDSKLITHLKNYPN